MTLALPDANRPMSREEYRRWYDAQPKGRFERIDGRIVAMAPEGERICGARRQYTTRWIAPSSRPAFTARPCPMAPRWRPATAITSLTRWSIAAPPWPTTRSPRQIRLWWSRSCRSAPRTRTPRRSSRDISRCRPVAHYLIAHPTRRQIIHHRRAGELIDTTIVVSGPIVLDPPGIVVTIEEIYGAE